MVFTTNQAKHFYVLSAKNTAEVKATKDGKSVYIQYEGPAGTLRSDIIKLDNIQYAKYTAAAKMQRELKAVQIVLDSQVNGGNPVVGQDYIVTINFKNYFGPDETHTYIKQAVARAFSNDPAELYKKLALSLARNFARDIVKPLKVMLNGTEVTPLMKMEELPEATEIKLVEVEQPWTLGIEESTPINFDITFAPITFEGNERIWGKAEKVASGEAPIGNGKKIADMEYFYAKERGDIYGNIGWPNVVKTTYVADPTKEYSTIDIHYSYVGPNESVQMSEKDITIACQEGDALLDILGALNAKGVKIENAPEGV